MSWHPTTDPTLGDTRGCDALDLVIVPRARDLGGFEVRRALPHVKRRMVGPFIFLDQMGPVRFIPGQGIDIRPHPHIGLSTVTYLFDGAMMHRDSAGHVREIRPGAMNLMTAGRGIAHSERTPDLARAAGQLVHGVQTWIALPETLEETEPSFRHYAADRLPEVSDHGVRARVVAGRAFGAESPVATASPWFYAEVNLAEGRAAPLDPDYEERAVYLVEGEVRIGGETFAAPALLIFRPGDRITVTATRAARLMFLGGEAMEGPRYVWWNFVSSRKDRIEQAKHDWKTGRFDPVPEETEFIPLPE